MPRAQIRQHEERVRAAGLLACLGSLAYAYIKPTSRIGSRCYHGSKGSTSRRQRGMIALVCVANRVRAMGSPELPSRLSKAKAPAVDYARVWRGEQS
jgi:hypothetical protein